VLCSVKIDTTIFIFRVVPDLWALG
jgi:hypothetical protein